VDILGAEEEHEPTVDVGEVINYVKAMRFGLDRVRKDDFPMSLRLLREIHAMLMQQVRGGKPALKPGEFRTGQNWIGGSNLNNARFIPPPADAMNEALGELESYLHAEDHVPPLIRCALIHYQFETVHPFNDGNGRMGRLLITFFLAWKKILDEPMLYLSAYLKAHQQEYYDRLMQVRNSGNFEAWVRFFLEGVVTVSNLVVQTTREIQKLERTDTERLIKAGIGHSGILLIRFLLKQPVLRVKDIEGIVGASYTKANSIVANAERLGVLKQISKGKRNRKYVYQAYIDILSEGTELPITDQRTGLEILAET
jgi:Fic family protein